MILEALVVFGVIAGWIGVLVLAVVLSALEELENQRRYDEAVKRRREADR